MMAAVARTVGGGLVLEEVAVPLPGQGEVLIKVIACGVCHSDIHAVDGDWDPPATLPLIPGHEVTGRVVALGSGAGSVGGIRVGQLVGVPWMFSSCGQCEYCLSGMETICPDTESTGYTKPGGYAEYMVARADFVIPLPDSADPVAIAPVLCAGVTSYRGLKRSGALPGQWVTVLGIGGLGHLAVQYAAAMGFRVAAVDLAADKLHRARSLGAEVTVDASAGDPVAAIHDAIGGSHATLVTAVAGVAFEQAVAMLRPAGTAIYLGMPGGTGDSIRTSISAVVGGELSIRGSSVGTRADLREAVGLAISGRVTATTSSVSLAEANDAFTEMRRGRVDGRIVLLIQ